MIPASGARFGRTRIAAPTASPLQNARRRERPTSASASVHSAAAGTSLIGCSDWNRNTGVVAATPAPSNAAQSGTSLRPTANTDHTARPAHNGTT